MKTYRNERPSWTHAQKGTLYVYCTGNANRNTFLNYVYLLHQETSICGKDTTDGSPISITNVSNRIKLMYIPYTNIFRSTNLLIALACEHVV